MTAARSTPARAAHGGRGATGDGKRRPRRWLRAAIPLAATAVLFLITTVAYAVEQPDPADPAFLSPVSDADIGARRLAERVRAAGVDVRRETRTGEALRAAEAGDATLLIPAPVLVHRDYLAALRLLPASTRIVLVEPQAATVRAGRLPVRAIGRRWATAARPPGDGCALPEARRAGPSAALRQRYGEVAPEAVELHRCYGDSLLALRWGGPEVVLAGATDPFRNDRIGEHGNASLATGLLTDRPRLIWLDLHRPDSPPDDSAAGPTGDPRTPGPPPPGDPSGDGSGERGNDGGRGDRARGDGDGDGRASSDDQPSPLLAAFPPWFWALLAQLALAALVMAAWRARRLGRPVAEPLPVNVRAAETVRGRGRLYQRARARGPALDILRSAARARLAALLKLPPDADPAALAAAVAAHTGRPEPEVEELLAGSAPQDDEDLVRMAGELDALLHAVTAPPSAAAGEDEH